MFGLSGEQGRAQMLLEIMDAKFGSIPDAVLATINAGTQEQLSTGVKG